MLHRLSSASILVRTLLAFAIVLGTTGESLCAVLCSAGMCADKCGIARTVETTLSPKSCCGSKQASSPASSKKKGHRCTCEIKSAPPGIDSAARIALPSTVLVIALPEAPATVVAVFPICSAPMFVSGDSSPPSAIRHPDLGRAPPSL
ncbi:MAG: hypothetical protein IT203_03175 [Fimbriimonadaceae bacterium]|nr:hypothetical protein [Fimbriimonadaceae bacterium]